MSYFREQDQRFFKATVNRSLIDKIHKRNKKIKQLYMVEKGSLIVSSADNFMQVLCYSIAG